MSDISSKPSDRQSPLGRDGAIGAAPEQPGASAATGVPNWRLTGTLSALQELVEVAESVPAVVARQAGLSTSELHSLRHLMRGPMGPVDLAKVLGVTSAASSGVVDRLVSHGHAVRQAHPDDGRRTEVVITDSGRAEVTARMRPMFVALAELDASLSDDDRVVVERYLRGATAAMHDLIA
ncbi:MarR family winged helix-turn-helix transcriptional regulator [Humibacillus xanthopallidus]|uniref:MarR family winged helix-turn-helix transcriptional regulator n=1 Tax=Humibacillus xanthopallidus TaxID=412689 RepID=UPI0021AB2448|nr:MarR family transcriptional regulator [Humibacillus xanthopallidus]